MKAVVIPWIVLVLLAGSAAAEPVTVPLRQRLHPEALYPRSPGPEGPGDSRGRRPPSRSGILKMVSRKGTFRDPKD